jgi:hypothetical protein
MKRIALVFLFASTLCLAITGLRLAVLAHIAAAGGPDNTAAPAGPLVAPRPVEDPDPLSDERPVEYVAGAPAAQPERAALLWLGVLREPPRAERRGE